MGYLDILTFWCLCNLLYLLVCILLIFVCLMPNSKQINKQAGSNDRNLAVLTLFVQHEGTGSIA